MHVEIVGDTVGHGRGTDVVAVVFFEVDYLAGVLADAVADQ